MNRATYPLHSSGAIRGSGLCESIRTIRGNYRDSPIIAFSPRASLDVAARPVDTKGSATTGPVGRAGSEVTHFPASYNIPLHLVAEKGEIATDWRARPPVHVHYHYLFAPNRHEVALEILGRLGVPTEQLQWLMERIPLGAAARASRVA